MWGGTIVILVQNNSKKYLYSCIETEGKRAGHKLEKKWHSLRIQHKLIRIKQVQGVKHVNFH